MLLIAYCGCAWGSESPSFVVSTIDTRTIYTATAASSSTGPGGTLTATRVGELTGP